MQTRKRLFLCLLLSLGASSAAFAGEYFSEAATNTKVQVSANPCVVLGYKVINRDATNPIYLHFYNALSANVTVGTTVQATSPIAVPAGGAVLVPVHAYSDSLESFGTALTIAITTSPMSNVSTAPGTAAVVALRYRQ